jgi:hypothetical protein
VPGFAPFFGTSAAAPHAAAVAALMFQLRPSATPAQVFSAMETTAIDMKTPGFDRDSGWGLLLANGAYNALTGGFTVTAYSPQTPTEGLSQSITVGTVNYPGTHAVQVTVNWGDGTVPYSTTLTGPLNNLAITPTHTYGEEGTYTIVFSATDTVTNQVVSTTGVAAVFDPPVVLSGGGVYNVAEGQSLTITGGDTFTDPGGLEPNASDPVGTINTHYSAAIAWGDGSTSAGTLVPIGGGTVRIDGSHTYGEEGTYTVTYAVNHEGVPSIISNVVVQVTDPHVIATGGIVNNVVEGQLTGPLTVARFTDPAGAEPNASDPGAIDAHYQALINFNDGTGAVPGIIQFSSGTFSILAPAHTFNLDEGTYTINVTITHESSTPQAVTSTVVVNEGDVLTPVPPTSAISAAPKLPVTVNQRFSDVYTANTAADFVGSISWGDGATTSPAIVIGLGGLGGPNAVYLVQGTHTYATAGVYTAIVTLMEDPQGSASAQARITVTVRGGTVGSPGGGLGGLGSLGATPLTALPNSASGASSAPVIAGPLALGTSSTDLVDLGLTALTLAKKRGLGQSVANDAQRPLS